MKYLVHLFIIIIMSGISNITLAQTYSVTFKINMSKESVSSNGVHIAGNFQTEAGYKEDWDPAATPLSDSDNDEIYETTLDIPQGVYEFKFVNGNTWDGGETPPGECTVGSNNNREISIYNDINLPVVHFDSCYAKIHFKVNMSNREIFSNGVHVMGNFQQSAGYVENWDPTTIKMHDSNNDSTFEAEVKVAPGDYNYLFVNGNTSSEAESLPDSCTIEGDDGKNVRTVTAKAGGNDPKAYCFNSCNVCAPSVSTNYETYWWNETVFYEIFVRSFNDSNGDGVGDFQGIIEKLDYLNDGDSTTNSDLGVEGIWLMPFNASPSYHGYDITDYYGTNPDYGSMQDLENLIEEAHKRGIKVIMDFVMNHSSNQHTWFTKSANNTDGYRDWYTWQTSDLGNNWHSKNGDYYFGVFYSGMPDLNYRNSEVKNKMFDIADFWLNKGLDGFRLDAIKFLYEDNTGNNDTQQTMSILEEFKNEYTSTKPKAFSVGEVWSPTSEITPYVDKERLDICFEFNLATSIINAVNNNNPDQIENKIEEITEIYPRLQYGTFLTNHDQDRIFSRFGSNMKKMKQAASIYLTMPGVPFVYYGEEVGMTGTGDHINIRRPMQWSGDSYAGFSSATPWTDLGNNYQTNNVADMEGESTSLLENYKKFIHLRNNHEALQKGYYADIKTNNSQMLSFARIYKDQAIIVLSNFGTNTENADFSLDYSALSAGTYKATDLLTNDSIDTVSVNSDGGFDNWSLNDKTIEQRDTRVISLSNLATSDSNDTTETVISASGVSKGKLRLYPNPAKNYFKINFHTPVSGNKLMEVYSLLGEKMYEKRIKDARERISTADWEPGIYLIKVKTDESVKTGRILIK